MAKQALLFPGLPFLFVVLFVCSVSYSQSPNASSLLPLESVLNPDGSFQAGARLAGSFDPRGWHMSLGIHGEPLFSRTPVATHHFLQADSDTGDVHWDDSFPGPVGTNDDILAIAVHGNDIYFGGLFTRTESIEASNIVRWDGTSWSALGAGVDGGVSALAFVDSILYVGGNFTHAGGSPANKIAAWDGTSWSSLGQSPHDGIGSTISGVNALISVGSDLYVGGYFPTVGNEIAASNIARWDGSTWHALGAGTFVGDFVYALATDGLSVYAAGFITKAGGAPANNIARWDGTAWHTLGISPNDGSNHTIYALSFHNGKLYIGGDFTKVGGSINANSVAEWDGSQWFSPGFSVAGPVWSLWNSGGVLFVSGQFTGGGQNRGCVAAWDSAQHTLSLLANGLNSPARAIADYGSDTYFAGSFTNYSNGDSIIPSNYVARWNGKQWMSLGAPKKPANSIAGPVGIYAIAVKDSDLYLGGDFDAAGTVAANNIVKWESRTQSWKSLGSGPSNGVDGQVRAIYKSVSGTIYVGGKFEHAGGSLAGNIAKWDGTAWSPLESGVHGINGTSVFAIAEASSATEYHLYVGGRFDSAGAVAASNVAEWTGTTWAALGKGVTGPSSISPGSVFALQPVFDRLFRHAKLYVGGDFIYAGGSPATRIAVWDAGTWSALGSPAFEGVLGPAYAIAGNRSAVYVGGWFQRAGGSVEVNNIAKWDGTAWSSVGKGVDNPIHALLLSGNSLYATGDFNNAAGAQANRIARWDFTDSSWHPLGSGFNDAGLALAPWGDDLYVGGVFTKAGGKRSYKLAHWNQSVIMNSVGADGSTPSHFSLYQNYPNPFNPLTIVKYTVGGVGDQGPGGRRISLVIYDILGRQVAVLVDEQKAPGNYQVSFDGSGLASGIYIYRLTSGQYVQSKKMVLLK